MAALLFADVIVDINEILCVLKAYDDSKIAAPVAPPVVVPLLPIAAPAPRRPAADFATVLRWEGSEGEPQFNDMYSAEVHDDSYLKSGGVYTQRLLARGRVVARYSAECDYARAMGNPALLNQAPPWPPAPELIANPPDWGVAATVQSGVAPLPSQVSELAVESVDEWSDEQSQAGTESHFLEEQPEGRSWDTASTSVYSERGSPPMFDEDEDKDECATGFFIGRDGNEWPMPPPECMPGSSPAPYTRQIDYRGMFSPSATEDSLADDEASYATDSDEAPLEPEGRVVWSAEGYDGDSDEEYEDEDVSERRTGYDTPPPLSHSTWSSPSSGSAPSPDHSPVPQTPPKGHCPSLADLGRQWYASFGKELQVRLPPLPYPSTPKPDISPKTSVVCEFDPWAYRSVPEARRGRNEAAAKGPVVPHILGRGASPWPTPPPPPDPYESDSELRRGRDRVPKCLG